MSNKWKEQNSQELMERAAKAAGYDVSFSEKYKGFVYNRPFNIDNPPTLEGMRNIWAPHINDGDSMRLAVRLGMFSPGSALAENLDFAMADKGEPYSAARLAILMTAADLLEAETRPQLAALEK